MPEVINTAEYNIRLNLSGLQKMTWKKADKMVTGSVDLSAKQVTKTTEKVAKKTGKFATNQTPGIKNQSRCVL